MKDIPRLHLIGNAHIDPVWLWRWQEGYAEIKATFRSALDRMNEFHGFIFTSACAAYYQWVEENAPEMFDEIRARVREGRWRIVGGMWIQPDCNVPSGESFARHFLISQRYFREKFGVCATSGYNVDSFGHNAAVPKLLNAAGIRNYVMMRPSAAENPELPGWVFWWAADDGSRVLTFRIPSSYNSRYGDADGTSDGVDGDTKKLRASAETAAKAGLPLMHFYGVGNHGGGPTILTLKALGRAIDGSGGDSIVMSTPDMYFDELRNGSGISTADTLPEWRGDLQHHASLCYSANSEIKRNNRRAENRLTSAEKYAVLAGALTGCEPPRGRLGRAWRNVLFNQFHDIMGGCSIYEAYDDAREAHGEALNIAAQAQNAAIQRISWAIGTNGGGRSFCDKATDWSVWENSGLGTPLVVFNPLAWQRSIPVRIGRPMARVTDGGGAETPVQRIRASRTNGADKWDSLFMADIPPMGYRVYWAYLGGAQTPAPADTAAAAASALPSDGLTARDNRIENGNLALELDAATGCVKSLYDKRSRREVFSGQAAVPLVVDVEHADTWGHALFEFRKVVGRFGKPAVTLLESGPVRAVLRSETAYGMSTLRQDFILYAGAEQVEVAVRLDWRERFKLLKLSFPANVDRGAAVTYDVPFGSVTRPADGREESGQMWFDASDGEKGLAILNDGKYAFDALGNDMRMTAANGSLYADHYAGANRDGRGEHLDQGVQMFTYALLPHEGSAAGNESTVAGAMCRAGIAKAATALNTEEAHIAETYHAGPLPLSYGGIGVSADNIIVTAVKPAEDGDGLVVRAYEAAGADTDCEISLPFCDAVIRARFGKNSVRTFRVSKADGAVTPCDLTEI